MAGEGPGAAPEDLFALVGTDLVGRFHVDAVVAEGGFGLVYRGVQLGLDRRVAIKVLKTPDDPKYASVFLSTFKEEARTIAKLQHPAIVQVVDFGTATMPSGVEAPFMVLEWINGRQLEDILIERLGKGGRPPAECLQLLRPVLEAVDVAHQAGVAHRDIKPPNIMVVESAHGASLRLLDFGIAKVMEGDVNLPMSGMTRTASGASAFSPKYAAPEQVSGARTGPWTDVHALGLVLVEMLLDKRAYGGRDITSLYREVLAPERPTPRRLGLDVGAWESVLLRALAPHPADRWESAGAFLRALVEALPGATFVKLPDLGGAETMPAMQAFRPGSFPPAVTAPAAADTTTPATLPASSPAPQAPAAGRGRVAVAAGVVLAIAAAGAFALRNNGASTPSASADMSVLRATPPAPRVAPAAAPAVAPIVAPMQAPAAPTAAPAVAAAEPAEPTAPAAVAPAAPAAPAPAAATPEPEAEPTGRHGRRGRASRARAAAEPAAPAAHAAPAAPAPPAAAPAAAASLPNRPSAADVSAAIDAVASRARACGVSGRVFVHVDFASDGHATGSSVEGDQASTPAGACIARAVRAAHVPPFARPSVTVVQPLSL